MTSTYEFVGSSQANHREDTTGRVFDGTTTNALAIWGDVLVGLRVPADTEFTGLTLLIEGSNNHQAGVDGADATWVALRDDAGAQREIALQPNSIIELPEDNWGKAVMAIRFVAPDSSLDTLTVYPIIAPRA